MPGSSGTFLRCPRTNWTASRGGCDCINAYVPLLHAGRTFNTTERDGAWLQGVVSLDQRHAVFAYVRLTTGAQARPGMLRIPGLEPQTRYAVQAISPTGADPVTLPGQPMSQPPWCSQPVTLTGQLLADYGLAMPVLNPAAGMLIEITAE
ncbi:hypothetical protein BH23ACT6_BH23ACT6_06520 [soil metagenome]